VNFEEGQRLAAKWRIPFIETSAKTGENVATIFFGAFVYCLCV
jgi:hypothetical protein